MYYNFKKIKSISKIECKSSDFRPSEEAFVVAIFSMTQVLLNVNPPMLIHTLKKSQSGFLFPLGFTVEHSCVCVVVE